MGIARSMMSAMRTAIPACACRIAAGRSAGAMGVTVLAELAQPGKPARTAPACATWGISAPMAPAINAAQMPIARVTRPAIWRRTSANAFPIAPARSAVAMAAVERVERARTARLVRVAVRAGARRGRCALTEHATNAAPPRTARHQWAVFPSAGVVSREPVVTTVGSVWVAYAVSRRMMSSVIAWNAGALAHWAGIRVMRRCRAVLDIRATSYTAIREFAGSNLHSAQRVLVVSWHDRRNFEATADPGRVSGSAVDASSASLFRARSGCVQDPCAAIWSSLDLRSRCCSASRR